MFIAVKMLPTKQPNRQVVTMKDEPADSQKKFLCKTTLTNLQNQPWTRGHYNTHKHSSRICRFISHMLKKINKLFCPRPGNFEYNSWVHYFFRIYLFLNKWWWLITTSFKVMCCKSEIYWNMPALFLQTVWNKEQIYVKINR